MNPFPSTMCSIMNVRLIRSFCVGNFALLPLRTRFRGPAYTLPQLPPGTSDLDVDPESESYDALDEVITLFRANTFFRNFEIRGPADRLLIYGILFVSECLGKIKPGMGPREAEKVRIRAVELGSVCTGSMSGKRYATRSAALAVQLTTDLFVQAVMTAAMEQFAIPGDVGFPLNQSYEAPSNKNDAETLRQYVLNLES